MSACALFIIGMTSRRRRVAAPAARQRNRRRRRRAASRRTRARRRRRARATPDVADDDRRQLARREALGVQSNQPLARQRSTTSTCPSAGRPYGCAAGYSSAISDSIARDGRVVLVLPDRGDDLALARRELVGSGSDGAIRMSPSSASTGSKSSARQVHDERQEVPRHGDRQRDAAVVELFGDLRSPIASPVPRSITRDSRYVAPGASAGSQIDPARIARLIVTAGVFRVSLPMTTTPLSRTVRAGARPRPVLRSECRSVRRDPSGRAQIRSSRADRTSRRCDSTSVSIVRAAPPTSSSVTAGDPRRQRAEHVDAGDGLEVSELVGDVRDAVVVEDQPRLQLRLGPRELRLGDAVARAPDRAPRAAPTSTDAERRPVGRGRRHRVEKRLLGRQQRAGHRRGEPALDQRAIQPRAALRRRHPEARPQVHALGAGQHRVEHQQREERRIGRPPARDSRPSGTPSCLRCRIVDAALAGLLRLDRVAAGRGSARRECCRSDARRAAAPRRCRRRRR